MNNPTLSETIARQVAEALAEDIGTGDLSAMLVPNTPDTHAQVVVKQEGAVLCGVAWFEACFRALDTNVHIHWHFKEGAVLPLSSLVCDIRGYSRALLSAERPALNFLQTLSATATHTRTHVEAIAGVSPNPHGCKILDTRKTLPGFRLAQKYAVRVGGGYNQRLALWHGILIKENHITAMGGIGAVLAEANNIWRAHNGVAHDPSIAPIGIQIEVENIAEMEEALEHGATQILLDDFSLDDLRRAVSINAHHHRPAFLEASGGINLSNIREVASTGVHRISLGTLTKDISAIDYSMRFVQD